MRRKFYQDIGDTSCLDWTGFSHLLLCETTSVLQRAEDEGILKKVKVTEEHCCQGSRLNDEGQDEDQFREEVVGELK